MRASRQSDKVTWWKMGKAATRKFGVEKARAMALDIRFEGIKNLFLLGAEGKPRPRVRPL